MPRMFWREDAAGGLHASRILRVDAVGLQAD
jgi:hypothetical protein